MKQLLKQQNGAASIFIVIFFALLISVITLSFMRIINTGQEQSRNSDLSKSAYDSANAGVEDAKRALDTYYKKNCPTNPSDPTCININSVFDKDDCKALYSLGDELGLKLGPTSPEVNVEQGSDDSKYNQAYTCANIDFKTDDYVRQLAAGNSDLIPLKAESSFNLVKFQWFKSEDAADQNSDFTLRDDAKLPSGTSNWGGNTPALMRLQLIGFNSGDKASDISNNSRTVFLVPAKTGFDPTGSDYITFEENDSSRNAEKPLQPVLVKCSVNGEYSCTANLKLATTGSSGHFLRVTPIYNQSTFRLSLYNGSIGPTPVKFNGVEPSVDITGRADDVYGRVITRLAPNDLTQNGLANLGFDSEAKICKTFYFGLKYSDNPSLSCDAGLR